MKKLLLFVFMQMVLCSHTFGQVLCVQCFEQNDSISSFVNNLVDNGGFERSTCTPGWIGDCYCPNSTKYNCDISDWLCTGGDLQSYPSIFDSTLSIIPQGESAAYFGNGNAYPCSSTFDDTSCIAAHSCVITTVPIGYPISNPGYGGMVGVSLEQTVNGLTVGETYVLEFWAGGESINGLLPDDGIFAVNIGFGRMMLRCNPTDETFAPYGTRFLIQFMATSTSHTIRFTNWGHVCTTCTELVLDDVRLYALDELDVSVAKCITKTKETKEDSSFALYPNPFTSELTILTDLPGTVEFMLFNNVSELVIHRKFQEVITLNTSALSAGIYYYRAKDQRGHYALGKIVKEK